MLESCLAVHKGIAYGTKLQNALLCDNDTVKLGNFESAVIRDEFGQTWPKEGLHNIRFNRRERTDLSQSDIEGTEVYLAPESLADPLIPYRADVADVWQLGILCVAVLLHRLF